jgi:hypothetical protein
MGNIRKSSNWFGANENKLEIMEVNSVEKTRQGIIVPESDPKEMFLEMLFS